MSKLHEPAIAIPSTSGGRFVTLNPDDTANDDLRVTGEPKNASYLCAKRIVISPSGSGTVVEHWGRYTDDQSNAAETAKQVREETVKAVAVFESLVK